MDRHDTFNLLITFATHLRRLELYNFPTGTLCWTISLLQVKQI